MKAINHRFNRVGGVDADITLENGETVPYTLADNEIANIPSHIIIAEYSPPPKDERDLKLNAFEFKGVSCSVCESDQNGWQAIDARINTVLGRGESFRPIPFFMENGNYVLLETHQEWSDFVDAGWSARESILMSRISQQ